MKAQHIISALLGGTLLLGNACQEESLRTELPSPEDQMHLSASAEDLTLNFYEIDNEAISFTWEKCGFEAEGIPYNLHFKMDIADNDFETAIDKIDVTGRSSISFTVAQLISYMDRWEVKHGNKAFIEAEIIASPVVEDISTQKYRKPEVSKIRFSATFIAPSQIHFVGPDLDIEFNTEDMFLVLQSGSYSFKSGDFSFMDLEVKEKGLWYIRPDYANNTVFICRPEAWIIGSACTFGWELGNMEEIPSANESGSIRRFKSILFRTDEQTPGELKIALRKNGLFEIPFLRPTADKTPIGEGDMVLWQYGENGNDDKWAVEQTGLYTISLDYENMRVNFEKSSVELPIYRIWMVGDATPGGWNAYPFPIKLRYDGGNEKDGIFVYEGTLQAGEFKFPLQEQDWFSPYLMPKNVDENNHAALPEDGGVSEMTLVEAGGPDQKWQVTSEQTGDYLLYLDVIDMKMTVYKK